MLVQTSWFSNQDRFFEGLQPTSIDNEMSAPERESDKKLSETFFTSLLDGYAGGNAKPAAC